MRDLALFLAGMITAVSLLTAAWAQTTTIAPSRAVVVSTCGTPPWTFAAGTEQPLTMDTTGVLCNKV